MKRHIFLGHLKLTAIVVFCFVITTSIFGRTNISLTGKVLDSETGAPVTDARVRVLNSSYEIMSGSDGEYYFDHLPPGEYRISGKAPGYEDSRNIRIDIKEDVTVRKNIYLERKVYYLGKIMVRDSRKEVSVNNSEVIFREDIEKSGARDLSELLDDVTGLIVQKSGSDGPARVKIRGSSSDQVLVLVDGNKINPSGSGAADMNSIPLSMVQEVEVYKGGMSAEFGPDALGGVVNIITRKSNFAEKLSVENEGIMGSWGQRKYNIAMSDLLSSEKFTSRFGYSFGQTDGDFDYVYVQQPALKVYEGTRRNNHFEEYNYFGTGSFRLNRSIELNFTGQIYDSERGLPGPVSQPTLFAHAQDRRRLLNITLSNNKGRDNQTRLDAGFSRFEQEFADDSTAFNYHGKYLNDIFTSRISQNISPFKNNNIKAGTEFRRDILYHDDIARPNISMGRTVRDNIAVYFIGEQLIEFRDEWIVESMVLRGAIRYDHTSTNKDSTSFMDTTTSNRVDYFSPNIGVSITAGDRINAVFRANYGKSFRLPSINALFWKGDVRAHGNPGLKPERSEHSEAGIEVGGDFDWIRFSAGVTYFHSSVKDLIIWAPRSGVWQPVNEERALITGHEDFVEVELFGDRVRLKYQNTITNGINKSDDHTVNGKALVFYPHYTTGFTAGLKLGAFRAEYNVRLVDLAYTLRSNNKWYSGYRVDDLNIGFNFNLSRYWQVDLSYRAGNLWDEEYVLMTHYPMSGREHSAAVKITYGIKD